MARPGRIMALAIVAILLLSALYDDVWVTFVRAEGNYPEARKRTEMSAMHRWLAPERYSR